MLKYHARNYMMLETYKRYHFNAKFLLKINYLQRGVKKT